MDLTTLARVKEYKTAWTGADANRDTFLGRAISALSQRFEKAINLLMLETERTETFDVDGLSAQRWRLSAFPVASVSTVKHATDRDFAAATAFDTDTFYFEPETGLLEVDGTVLSPGRRSLQVVYTGGFAADTNAFIAAYPDIAQAIEEMAAFLFEERNRLGQISVSGQESVTLYQKVAWLPNAQEVIEQYRRRF